MFRALLRREWRLLCANRAQLLVLGSYPLLLLLTGALALDLPRQDATVRTALLLIAFVLLPVTLVGTALRAELVSGVLLQLRGILLTVVSARYLTLVLGVLLPVTALLLVAGTALLNLDIVPLILPLLLTLPGLGGLLLLVAALLPDEGTSALGALLLLPLATPLIVLLTLATTGGPGVAAAATWWLGATAVLGLGLLPLAITAALRQKLTT